MPKKILFVCTGNTCRSPMAEGLAQSLALKLRLELEFRSAGTAAVEGVQPSLEAVIACAKLGADIADHVSVALSRELVDWADIVIGMENAHLHLVRAFCDKEKSLRLLGDCGIPDPIGKGQKFYEEVALRIKTEIERLVRGLKDENYK